MAKLKEMINLRIKEPAAVLLRETGKIPFGMVLSHVRRSWVENSDYPERVREKAHENVQKKTFAYLSKRYGNLTRELVNRPQPGERLQEPVLWVFWWQGEDAAPEIVKICIRSMRKHSGDARLQVVDSFNYREFVPVSEGMEEKLRCGQISLTHFSDYYRMALLEHQGGIWIDGSVFVQRALSGSVFEKPLFTMRNPGQEKHNISDWNWTVGVLGGWKGNTLFSACRRLLEMYWQDHSFPVDYFIFDYFIKLVYESCPMVREQIEAVSPNNADFYRLQQCADQLWSDQWAREMETSDTWLYKLSWKGQYLSETADGRQTVYAKWLHDNTADEKTEKIP